MKYLLPIFLLISIISCDPETSPPPDDKPYIFEAHFEGDSIFIHYQAVDIPAQCYYIEMAANSAFTGNISGWGITPNSWQFSDCHGAADGTLGVDISALKRWNPTWVRVETQVWADTIRVD